MPTDAGDEPSCRIRRPRLVPTDKARTSMPGAVILGGRKYTGTCPPEAVWRRLVPFVNFRGEFEIGTPDTPRATAAENAIASFLVACFAAAAVAEVVERFKVGEIDGAEGIQAAQDLVRGWWPEVEVHFDGELLS